MAPFDFSGEPRLLWSLMDPKITATVVTPLIVNILRVHIAGLGKSWEITRNLVPICGDRSHE